MNWIQNKIIKNGYSTWETKISRQIRRNLHDKNEIFGKFMKSKQIKMKITQIKIYQSERK
jgi:hypothetical protein